MKQVIGASARCQRAVDKRAPAFGPLDAACVASPVKEGAQPAKAIAKACAGIAGHEVGSCAGLPQCVVEHATATGRAIAAGMYAKPVPGAPGARALDAVPGLDDGTRVTAGDLGLDEAGAEVVLTQIEVGLVPDATVGQIDELLRAIGGRIVSSIAGVAIVVVGIPHPGDVAGLDAVTATLEADPAVRFTNRAYLSHPDALPDNHTPDLADGDKIGHHLAVQAHGAWNAKDGIGTVPVLFVIDFFGDGKPDGALGGTLFDDQFLTGRLDDHGYHVLGIARGAFGGEATPRGLVTGMFPGQSGTVNVTDLQSGLSSAQWHNFLIDDLKTLTLQRGVNVVVNTSLGFGCDTPASVAAFCNQEYAARQAVIWIEKVRGAGVEDEFVHVDSAGNVNVPGDVATPVNDAWAAATLLPGLETLDPADPQPVPNLRNTLVVENLDWHVADGAPSVKCLSALSKVGGNVAAVGSDVWSIIDADAGAGFLSGTSMAAPQVAGLVQLVWALDPTLSATEVVDLVLGTARSGAAAMPADASCSASASAPVLDAYAAVLGVDLPDALDGGAVAGAPARLAVLDVAGDGAVGTNRRFDEDDLEVFLTGLDVPEPAARDFSRLDLNGDGFTGGNRTAPFDLDASGLPATGELTREVDGTTMLFDEAALGDVEILCYYAFSPLYTGDTATRDELLVPHCVEIELEVSFPEIVVPGEDTELVVRAVRRRDDGSTAGAAGLHVALEAIAGGAVADASGTTAADGFFRTTARLAAGSEVIEILVALSTTPEGRHLDAEIVYGEAAEGDLTVEPFAAAVPVGGQQQFTAFRDGIPTTAVIWSATGGTITSGGLFTAGDEEGFFTVTATSTADPNVVATVDVEIVPPSFVVSSVSVREHGSAYAQYYLQPEVGVQPVPVIDGPNEYFPPDVTTLAAFPVNSSVDVSATTEGASASCVLDASADIEQRPDGTIVITATATATATAFRAADIRPVQSPTSQAGCGRDFVLEFDLARPYAFEFEAMGSGDGTYTMNLYRGSSLHSCLTRNVSGTRYRCVDGSAEPTDEPTVTSSGAIGVRGKISVSWAVNECRGCGSDSGPFPGPSTVSEGIATGFRVTLTPSGE